MEIRKKAFANPSAPPSTTSNEQSQYMKINSKSLGPT